MVSPRDGGNMGGAWRALDIDLSGRISLLELMPGGNGHFENKTWWRWVGFVVQVYDRFL